MAQQEDVNMASEPIAAYNAVLDHVQMSFDIPRTFDEKSFRQLMTLYAKRLVGTDRHIEEEYRNRAKNALGEIERGEARPIEEFFAEAEAEFPWLCK